MEQCRRVAVRLAAVGCAGQTQRVLLMLLMLEAFWPSRRIAQFDELCSAAA
jgi:hypothetical protein